MLGLLQGHKVLIKLFVLFFLFCSLSVFAYQIPTSGQSIATQAKSNRSLGQKRRLIVELEESFDSRRLPKEEIKLRRAQHHALISRGGGRIIHPYGKLKNRIVVEIPASKVDKLHELPNFLDYREDLRVHALLEDSAYQIYADYAWANEITGQGVKVAVVDTGIDLTHPDLTGKVVAQYDFTTNTPDAMDDNGHGTHCAGIIASEGAVYHGISSDVSLIAAKVLDSTGNGYASDVMLGIQWAVEQGADVINMSLGEGQYSGTCDYTDLAQVVNEAVAAGVVVCCASGNDGNPNALVSPACASGAIAVGSVDKMDVIASYSDGGVELDLVAPGGDTAGGANYPEIVSTFSTEVANNPEYCFYLVSGQCYDSLFIVDGARYIRATGTSMAAPHVSGAAALVLQANPELSPAEVKDILEQSADDLGTPGWDNVYGWGRLNIAQTLPNIPPLYRDLSVTITEPNFNDPFVLKQAFWLRADIECLADGGCGEIEVYAQFCSDVDCNDFNNVSTDTVFSSGWENPIFLGTMEPNDFNTVQWELLPRMSGDYTLRVYAVNPVSGMHAFDSLNLSVIDPNLPALNSIECLLNGVWKDCTEARYGDLLKTVRIDAEDPQGPPQVQLTLINVPDQQTFINELLPYDGNYFTTDPNLIIADSGNWQMDVLVQDSDLNIVEKSLDWNVPWGELSGLIIEPSGSVSVPKGSSLNITTDLQCLGGECPDAQISLNLNEAYEISFDDGTAEDYGEIGSSLGYIAVRFIPKEYPAKVKAARFYIWDETTYPFELHIWDDDGDDFYGAPGTELVVPFIVDPVTTSVQDVKWFDIDLSDYNIQITSGTFYIGWQQVNGVNNNQVGFDTNGPLSYLSYGYLPFLGWFNLSDYYSGNIMIRAVFEKAGAIYEGILPNHPGPAPLYTLDTLPFPGGDLNVGEHIEKSFQVYSVGAVGEDTDVMAVFQNSYSRDVTSSIKITVADSLTTCHGANLNAVGRVDLVDFVLLAQQWLNDTPPLSSDINGDSSVDIQDLEILSGCWQIEP
ncbi:MAG: S8 family serine peptidase [Bacteroidota bacterium]